MHLRASVAIVVHRKSRALRLHQRCGGSGQPDRAWRMPATRVTTADLMNSEEAQLARLRDCRRAIVYLELPKNPMQMPLGRPHRNRHLKGDLLIAETAAESPKKFGFPVGQGGTLSHPRLIGSRHCARASCTTPVHETLSEPTPHELRMCWGSAFQRSSIEARRSRTARGAAPSSDRQESLRDHAPWRRPPGDPLPAASRTRGANCI